VPSTTYSTNMCKHMEFLHRATVCFKCNAITISCFSAFITWIPINLNFFVCYTTSITCMNYLMECSIQLLGKNVNNPFLLKFIWIHIKALITVSTYQCRCCPQTTEWDCSLPILTGTLVCSVSLVAIME